MGGKVERIGMAWGLTFRKTALAAMAVLAAFVCIPAEVAARDSEGVKVPRRSMFRNLVPAASIEGTAQTQYAQMTAQASQQGKLLGDTHPQVVRLRKIAADL